jgi:hypothetical protein
LKANQIICPEPNLQDHATNIPNNDTNMELAISSLCSASCKIKHMIPTVIHAPPIFYWGVQKLFDLVKNPSTFQECLKKVSQDENVEYISGNRIIMQFSEDKTVKDVPFDNVCTSIFGDGFDLHRMKMEVVKYIFSRIRHLPCVRDDLVSIDNLSLLLDARRCLRTNTLDAVPSFCY